MKENMMQYMNYIPVHVSFTDLKISFSSASGPWKEHTRHFKITLTQVGITTLMKYETLELTNTFKNTISCDAANSL